LNTALTGQSVPFGQIFSTELFRDAAFNNAALDEDPTFTANARTSAGSIDMDTGLHGGANEIVAASDGDCLVVGLKEHTVSAH
jgi:hypothetical protein